MEQKEENTKIHENNRQEQERRAGVHHPHGSFNGKHLFDQMIKCAGSEAFRAH
jgi:hypothetical protein